MQKNIENFLRNNNISALDLGGDSVGKATCHKAWWHKFDPQNLHSGENWLPQAFLWPYSQPATCWVHAHVHAHEHSLIQMCAHSHMNK